MARIKVWQPITLDALPPGLVYALNQANREAKRNWAVCQQVVVENDVPQAEILRLREQVRTLSTLVERSKKGEVVVKDVYTQVKEKVMQGQTIGCLKSQWPEFRAALQKLASWALDNKQVVYANIALNEVRRLDRVFEYQKEGNP